MQTSFRSNTFDQGQRIMHDDLPSSEDAPSQTLEPAVRFPLWVRGLAMVFVLSRFVGMAGFVLLGTLAWWRYFKQQALDIGVLVLAGAAVACPLCIALFQWWFVRMGRRRWPGGHPHDEPNAPYDPTSGSH